MLSLWVTDTSGKGDSSAEETASLPVKIALRVAPCLSDLDIQHETPLIRSCAAQSLVMGTSTMGLVAC